MKNQKGYADSPVLWVVIALILMFVYGTAKADGLYVFGGIYAYDDLDAGPDYQGLSPNGEYGLYLKHKVDDSVSLDFGYKHSSSMAYREKGDGFNGYFINVNIKLVDW